MKPYLVGLVAVTACSGGLRVPPSGPQPPNVVPIVVDYPPPPAQIERIEQDPGKPCVWVDGSYVWLGRRWEWTPGQWVAPRVGCYYRGGALVWAPTTQAPGTLYYFPPKWYTERANGITECPPAERCRPGTG